MTTESEISLASILSSACRPRLAPSKLARARFGRWLALRGERAQPRANRANNGFSRPRSVTNSGTMTGLPCVALFCFFLAGTAWRVSCRLRFLRPPPLPPSFSTIMATLDAFLPRLLACLNNCTVSDREVTAWSEVSRVFAHHASTVHIPFWASRALVFSQIPRTMAA